MPAVRMALKEHCHNPRMDVWGQWGKNNPTTGTARDIAALNVACHAKPPCDAAC